MSIYIDWMVHRNIHLSEVDLSKKDGAKSPDRAKTEHWAGVVVSTVKDREWRSSFERLLRSIRRYNWHPVFSQ